MMPLLCLGEGMAGWKCRECGEKTIWNLDKMDTGDYKRNEKGELTTNHAKDCSFGLKQKEIRVA